MTPSIRLESRRLRSMLSFAILAFFITISDGRATPSQKDSVFEAGVRLYMEGQFTAAIRSLAAAAQDTLTAEVAFYLGASYAVLNDASNGRRYLQMAVNQNPENTGYRYRLAQLLAQSGDASQAASHYAMILERDSSHLSAMFQLGLLAYERREMGTAARHFHNVLARNPRDYLAQYYLGSALAAEGLNDSARTVLSSSVSLNPSYTPGVALLASLYYQKPDYREAARLYARAITQRPDNAGYWYSKGLCEEKLDDMYGAVDSYRTAARLDTTDALILGHLGQAWFQLNRFDSAASAYTRATIIEPDNPTLFVNLALSWQRLKSTDRAAAAFERAIQALDPEKISRVYGQLGALYFIAERYRDALRAYRRSLQINPSNLDAQFYVALTYDHMADIPAARQAYKRFVTNARTNPAMTDKLSVAKKRLALLQSSGR